MAEKASSSEADSKTVEIALAPKAIKRKNTSPPELQTPLKMSATQASSQREHLEDVFQEITSLFDITAFKKFAESKNGLCLDQYDIQTIVEDHQCTMNEQKLRMLFKWRENIGEKATILKICHLLQMYLKGDNPPDYIVLENGKFGVYKNCFLCKRSNVYLGVQASEVTGTRIRAIKFVPKSEKNLREAKLLVKLGNHVNVVSSIHAGIHHAEPHDYIYIAMEHSWTQTVRDMLEECIKLRKAFFEITAWNLVEQLMRGVEFLHSHNIIHGDPRPEKVLGSPDWRFFKLIVSGLSKEINATIQTDANTGHDGYRSCETYNQSTKITAKADIFTAGVTIAEILANGKHPFGEEPDLWRHYIRTNKNPDLSHLCVSYKNQVTYFIKRMLEMDPEKRPTAKEVLKDVSIHFQTFRLKNQKTTAGESSATTSKAMSELSITKKVNAIIMFNESDNHLYSYKPITRKWSRMQEFSNYVEYAATVASDKYIYIIQDQEVFQLEYSDPAAKWKQMSSMIEYHGENPPAVRLNGFIYVCGRGYDAEASRSVERYDAGLDRWDHMCDMNIGRCNSCIAATKDYIYCMGGKDENREPLQFVERFDERLNKWEFVESLPRPILGASAAVVKNRIYVANDDRVLCYDIQNNSWSETNQRLFMNGCFVKILAVDGELFIIGDISSNKTSIYLFEPDTKQSTLVKEFEDERIDVRTCLAVWHLSQPCASNKDKKNKSNKRTAISMKYDMNAKRQEFQDTEHNEARNLMDIQFDKIKSETSRTFTLCHQKLIPSDAEYFCSELKPDFSLKELNFRNCNVDEKFLLAIQKNIPHGKVEHANFSGNNQIEVPALMDLMTRWGCKSLDLCDIEFDEKKINVLRRIPLETLILDHSSFPLTSNAMGHVAELLQSLENLSLVSSSISTDQLVLIADNLSDGIKLQSLNLSDVHLEDKGLKAVCKIINKTKGMKKLSLSNSGLNAGKLEVFSNKVTQKIEELDLGLNRNSWPTDMKKIIEIVKRQHVRKLNLTGLALNQQALKQLTASDIPCGQITDLNISENSGICTTDVGELAAKLKIQNLDISECWLGVDDLKKLPISMSNHKLDSIDVTESSRVLNEERRKEIRSMLLTVAKEVRIENA